MRRELNLIFTALQIPDGPAPYIEGSPGEGKTAVITQGIRSLGMEPIVLLGSIRRPEDFGGFPVVEGQYVTRKGDSWIREVHEHLAKSRRVAVFIDEITCVDEETQKALLRPVLEGVVGDIRIPKDRVRFLAAGNPVSQATGGWELGKSLMNRFLHIVWPGPSAEEWVQWNLSKDLEVQAPLLDTSAFAESLRYFKGEFSTYLTTRPEQIREKVPEDSRKAWACPRTIDFAQRMMAGLAATEQEDLFLDALKGCVGEGWAAEFLTWRRNLDLPSPEALVKGEASFAHKANRPDRTMALGNSLACWAKSKEPPVYKRAFGVFCDIFADKDIPIALSIPGGRLFLADAPGFDAIPAKAQVFLGRLMNAMTAYSKGMKA